MGTISKETSVFGIEVLYGFMSDSDCSRFCLRCAPEAPIRLSSRPSCRKLPSPIRCPPAMSPLPRSTAGSLRVVAREAIVREALPSLSGLQSETIYSREASGLPGTNRFFEAAAANEDALRPHAFGAMALRHSF